MVVAIDDAVRIFRLVAPEFSSIPDEDYVWPDGKLQYGIKTYMELFADEISCRRFGKSYAKALAYMTAHRLKMMDMSDDAGSDGLGSMALGLRIASASEGETSVSFGSGGLASSSDPDADYALTIYGLEFLKLRRMAIIGIVSAGEPIYNIIPGYPHRPDCVNHRS